LEQIWKNFKETVFASIERFFHIQFWWGENPDPEYYNREEKRLKVKVRRNIQQENIRRTFPGGSKAINQADVGKKKKSVLQSKGKCWTEFCKYIKKT
jgi:fructose-1,6-bisphosphatase/inositol monophosphatase family enzyme